MWSSFSQSMFEIITEKVDGALVLILNQINLRFAIWSYAK